MWNRDFYRIWRDQWKVRTGLLLIVFWLEFNIQTVLRVNWKVKSGIFYYLFGKYFLCIKDFEINSFTTIHVQKQNKNKNFTNSFSFSNCFSLAHQRNIHIVSQKTLLLVIQLQFLIEIPKLFDTIDFSTLF